MNWIEIEIYKAVPLIEEMIKPIALAEEVGKNSTWYVSRKNRNHINSFVYTFKQQDVDLINESLQRIGNRLLETRITYIPRRIAVIKQIKNLSKTVQLKYIYEHEMHKKRSWFFNRTKKDLKNIISPCFTPDDVISINLAIINIANRILTLKVTL